VVLPIFFGFFCSLGNDAKGLGNWVCFVGAVFAAAAAAVGYSEMARVACRLDLWPLQQFLSRGGKTVNLDK
jgi:hypothetical protein